MNKTGNYATSFTPEMIKYMVNDQIGSTRVLLDGNGNVDWFSDYEPFGQNTNEKSFDEQTTTDQCFTSYTRDMEIGLQYAMNRYMDSSLGRFISEDPIKDGLNWYVYVSSNPLRSIDPTGLSEAEENYARTSSGSGDDDDDDDDDDGDDRSADQNVEEEPGEEQKSDEMITEPAEQEEQKQEKTKAVVEETNNELEINNPTEEEKNTEVETAEGVNNNTNEVTAATVEENETEKLTKEELFNALIDKFFENSTGKSIPDGGMYLDSRDGGTRQHKGVDISAAEGTNIKSGYSGEVIYIDDSQSSATDGRGNNVIIKQEDGTKVRIQHMKDINVEKGDTVNSDTIVGTVGNTGAGGYHFHVEFYTGSYSTNNREYKDPAIYLKE